MTDYEIYSLQSYTDGIEEDLRPVKRAEFEDLRGTFKVTFRKEKQEMIAQNITENCTENCTDNEIKLLELLKINPNITQVELSKKLNVSRRTISTLLSHLKERGKIERVGSDRKGYWKILK